MTNFPIAAMQNLGTTQTALCAGAAAVFYVCAMISMKLWADAPTALLTGIIVIALLIGTVFEIAALHGERLGMIYVTILALEVVLIAIAACLLFGESYSYKEVAGCLLVLAGTAVAWS